MTGEEEEDVEPASDAEAGAGGKVENFPEVQRSTAEEAEELRLLSPSAPPKPRWLTPVPGDKIAPAPRAPPEQTAPPMPCNPDVPDGIAADQPPELRRLLDAPPGPERNAAWTEFLDRHSRLMLHAARSVTRDRETAMDAYVDMIERLGERDCARLRAFLPDGRARFTTWLVLVARRLALDWQRRRYGRVGRGGRSEAIATRRRLEDLTSAVADPAELASRAAGPDEEFLARERSAILAGALARLDPRERLILALRFEDGASASEVARLLGFPTPFHVHRRVASLVRRLRADLRSRGLGQP